MKKYLVIPIIFIFAVFSSCQKVEPTVLTLSGTVESKDVRISSLVGG
jgi:hypothetical protein